MKFIRYLDDRLEGFFLLLLSLTMIVAIALQIFMRVVLGSSLSWSEELARYCFIWLVYIGVSFGVKKQRHIKVDAVLLLLNHRWKIILNIVANIIFLVFAIVIIIYGYKIADQNFTYGQKSPALGIPMGLVYMATPVGMGLTSIRIIQQIIKQFKSLFGKQDFEVKTEQERMLETPLAEDQSDQKNGEKEDKQ